MQFWTLCLIQSLCKYLVTVSFTVPCDRREFIHLYTYFIKTVFYPSLSDLVSLWKKSIRHYQTTIVLKVGDTWQLSYTEHYYHSMLRHVKKKILLKHLFNYISKVVFFSRNLILLNSYNTYIFCEKLKITAKKYIEYKAHNDRGHIMIMTWQNENYYSHDTWATSAAFITDIIHGMESLFTFYTNK